NGVAHSGDGDVNAGGGGNNNQNGRGTTTAGKSKAKVVAGAAPGAAAGAAAAAALAGRTSAFGLNARQLRVLLQLLRGSLLESERQGATLGLLGALIDRGVLLPELYDLMDAVVGLAVTSHRPAARRQCRNLFLRFLVGYPLGEKRLKHHFQQLLGGLEFRYPEGRLAATAAVEALVRQLPTPLLDSHAHPFFLTLTVRLVNDASPDCRSAAAAAVAALLRRVSPDVFYELLAYVRQWFGGGGGRSSDGDAAGVGGAATGGTDGGVGGAATRRRRALRRTAAQAAGIFVEARPELLRRGLHLSQLLGALATALPEDPVHAQAVTDEDSAAGGSEQDGDPGFIGGGGGGGGGPVQPWECVYFAATAVEKAFAALPGACDALADRASVNSGRSGDGGRESSGSGGGGNDNEDGDSSAAAAVLLDKLCRCLLYPHAWVRLAVARAWGVAFSRRDPSTLLPRGGGGGSGGDGSKSKNGSGRGGSKSMNGGGGEEEGDDTRAAPPTAAAAGVGGTEDGGGFFRRPGVVFLLCKQTCAQLDRTTLAPPLAVQAVKNLVFLSQAMRLNPQFCYADADSEAHADVTTVPAGAAASSGDDGGDARTASVDYGNDVVKDGERRRVRDRDPLLWLFHRLSYMARPKGEARRCAAFRFFAAAAAGQDTAFARRYLPHMLAPLRRAQLDADMGDIAPHDAGGAGGGIGALGKEGGRVA
ncbi:unnamed protein product, partial [Phaeothamnion confervicola]